MHRNQCYVICRKTSGQYYGDKTQWWTLHDTQGPMYRRTSVQELLDMITKPAFVEVRA